MSTAELLDLGSRPIRPDAAAGVPGRDEPEFEALQAEVRKLELPDQPTIDWGLAVRSASTLLGQKSKDLLVASFLCVGLLETEGFAGLATGLTIVRDLVANFWETLYPEAKRMRGRVAAFEWLAERGVARVQAKTPGPDQAEPIAKCLALIQEISTLLGPRVDGGDALLSDLRRGLDDATQRMRSPAAPASAAASSASTSGVGAIESPGDMDAALAESKRLLRACGDFLRASDPKNPLAYRLPRIAAWMGIAQLPPNADGKTQIPGIQPPDFPEKLEQALGTGTWAGVVEQSEGKIASAVLWLDLHRYTALALEGMGDEFHAAADAVCRETAALLARLPGLADLRFQNDQPLANPATREWIRQRVLAASAGGDAGAAPSYAPASAASAGAGSAHFEEAKAAAWKLARQRKLAEAVALLEEGATRSAGLRDRVPWKLEVARICLDRGRPETALAQLEAIDAEVTRASVEDWDPRLCAEVIKSLLLCRQKALSSGRQQTPDDQERARKLLDRLCRIDVVSALEMNGKK